MLFKVSRIPGPNIKAPLMGVFSAVEVGTACRHGKALNLLRDDVKSSGKFTIFSYLIIEGGGGRRQITEKWDLKINLQLKIEGGGGLRADL